LKGGGREKRGEGISKYFYREKRKVEGKA